MRGARLHDLFVFHHSPRRSCRPRYVTFQAFSKPDVQGSDPEAITPLNQVEKRAILHAIELLKGDKLQAARRLGIGKTTLYRKLKEYGSTV